MVTPELLSYINTRLSQGATQEQIRQELTSRGWNATDIDTALHPPSNAPISPAQPTEPHRPNVLLSKLRFIKFRYFHNSLIPIILILIALILVGGGGGWYLYYQSPEQQFKRLFEKLENISTLAYKGTAKVTITVNQKQHPQMTEVLIPYISFQKPLIFSVKFNGESDLTNRKAPKSTTSYNLDFTGSIFNITAQFETLYSDEKAYIKIIEFPDIGYFDTGPFVNQWIELEDTQHNSPSTSYRLSRGEEQQLITIVKEKQILTITKRLSDKKINTVSASGYAFTIPKEKLTIFLKEYKSIISSHVGPQTLHDIDEAVKLLKTIKPISGELWLEKWSGYPARIVFTIESDNKDQFVNVSITSVINLSHFNQPVAIKKPESVQTLSQLMEKYSSQLSPNPSNPSASDSAIMSAPSSSSLLFLNTLAPLLTP